MDARPRATPRVSHAIARADVHDDDAFDALVHVRASIDAIPRACRLARADKANGARYVRSSERSIEDVDVDKVQFVLASDVAPRFEIARKVCAFEKEGEVKKGKVRSCETTSWPPTYVVECEDGSVIRAHGSELAHLEAYEREVKRREEARRREEADSVARELLEEERLEKEREERARAKKEGKKGKKGGDGAMAKERGVTLEEGEIGGGEGEGEGGSGAADADARREAQRLAEKAAQKAAARARQEEIKADKAAKEKAAKKEAQRARKAEQRAIEILMAANETRAPASANDAPATTSADNKTVDSSANAKELSRGASSESDELAADADDDVDKVKQAQAIEQPHAPVMTETQRRKIAKERRKAQRLAEIDSFLKSQEVLVQENKRISKDGEDAESKSKKRKKKKKLNAAKNNERAVKSNSDWFAAFAVVSFFTLAALIYYVSRNFYSVALRAKMFS